jgi:hypothetical protein
MKVRNPYTLICLLFLLPVIVCAQTVTSGDLDRDGIPDQLEQALLEKFQPTFMISPLDCDLQPAEFQSGTKDVIALDRNGTIYGQVFRPPANDSTNGVLELHYYHLWARDCGKMDHAFDAEYVASLIHMEHAGDAIENWTALYWYAAAHEGTVCDTSTIVRAMAIAPQDGGPRVWVSAGKHGSYFNRESCELGCGQDRCVNSVPLQASKLINVGETGATLNGAEWTSSAKWNLAQKMQTAFSPEMLAAADKPGSEPVLARRSNTQWQSTIAAMGTSLDAAGLGPQHTSAALSTARTKTRNALALSFRKLRSSLNKASQATAQWGERQGTP